MRLIDADAFKAKLAEEEITFPMLDFAPTVEAIPIEWMLNSWDSKEYADFGYQVMRRIIADWAERRTE